MKIPEIVPVADLRQDAAAVPLLLPGCGPDRVDRCGMARSADPFWAGELAVA